MVIPPMDDLRFTGYGETRKRSGLVRPPDLTNRGAFNCLWRGFRT